MNARILVAYATKHGATKGIAEKIGHVLREGGWQAEVLPADRAASGSDLDSYDAVVLGSAVYGGQWRKGAASFLEAHEGTLAGRPVWLFSSGPTGEGDPVDLMNGWRFPEGLQPVADRIQPRDIAFFHGVLNTNGLSLPEKLIVKALKAPTGDFRDWEAITAWAQGIAAALEKEEDHDGGR